MCPWRPQRIRAPYSVIDYPLLRSVCYVMERLNIVCLRANLINCSQIDLPQGKLTKTKAAVQSFAVSHI